MKKLLLIGLVLAICILAMPQGVSAALDTPKTVEVNAQLESTSSFNAAGLWGEGFVWQLSRGNNVLYDGYDDHANGPAVELVVDSNLAYDITASGTNSGQMIDSNGNKYQTPLWIDSKDLSTAPVLVSNGALGTGVTFDYYLGQTILDSDSANLPHSITITFDMTAH
jgi:hypothetical protein